jgi:transposase-like protein
MPHPEDAIFANIDNDCNCADRCLSTWKLRASSVKGGTLNRASLLKDTQRAGQQCADNKRGVPAPGPAVRIPYSTFAAWLRFKRRRLRSIHVSQRGW